MAGLRPRVTLSPRWRALVVVGFLLAAGAFLWLTPPGPLDKVDAFGYAVCHRITSHSFVIGGRQLPLCARCTGIYLGAALTMIALAAGGRGRSSRLPGRPIMFTLLAFIGVMGIDGLNSYIGFFHGLIPQLYASQNWLRLATGTLDGVAMAALVVPLFNNSFWREPAPEPSVRSFRELAGLVALAGAGAALVLADVDILLVPIALVSVAGLVAMLTAVVTTIALILLGGENRIAGRRAALWALLGGFALTLVMVTGIDMVRFALTGTWGGFPIPF